MPSLEEYLQRLERLTRQPDGGWSLVVARNQLEVAHKLIVQLLGTVEAARAAQPEAKAGAVSASG